MKKIVLILSVVLMAVAFSCQEEPALEQPYDACLELQDWQMYDAQIGNYLKNKEGWFEADANLMGLILKRNELYKKNTVNGLKSIIPNIVIQKVCWQCYCPHCGFRGEIHVCDTDPPCYNAMCPVCTLRMVNWVYSCYYGSCESK